jgi:hypothetical protein
MAQTPLAESCKVQTGIFTALHQKVEEMEAGRLAAQSTASQALAL